MRGYSSMEPRWGRQPQAAKAAMMLTPQKANAYHCQAEKQLSGSELLYLQKLGLVRDVRGCTSRRIALPAGHGRTSLLAHTPC